MQQNQQIKCKQNSVGEKREHGRSGENTTRTNTTPQCPLPRDGLNTVETTTHKWEQERARRVGARESKEGGSKREREQEGWDQERARRAGGETEEEQADTE